MSNISITAGFQNVHPHLKCAPGGPQSSIGERYRGKHPLDSELLELSALQYKEHFQSVEAVSHCRDSQLQVTENYT